MADRYTVLVCTRIGEASVQMDFQDILALEAQLNSKLKFIKIGERFWKKKRLLFIDIKK